MIRTHDHASPWRALWLIPVTIFAALTIVATGGGGGGDDGGSSIDDIDPGPVNLLPTYNFFLTNLSSPSSSLLTATLASGITVSFDIDGLLANTLDISADSNNNVTFLSYAARAGSSFDLLVMSMGASPLDARITVTLTQDLTFGGIGVPPASGAFNVVVPAGTVRVIAIGGGVQVGLNDNEAVFYTWDEFAALLDDENQDLWLRQTSLAGGAFEFLYGYFFDIADILDELELITLTNPLVESCDMFTGSPPDGVLAQGQITVTWTGSGELSDGDDFTWDFNQCWFDEPNDVTDELLDGTVLLQDYTETVDFNTNTLFEIGFGGLSGQPGGVIFDLTVSETVENNGVFTISPDDVIRIHGGFAMIIQSP